MRALSSRRGITAGVIVIVLATAALVPVGAHGAAATGTAIGRNQHYVGLVNGKHKGAVIRVVCPGPAGGTRTGPPAGKQSVSVRRVRSGGGYTGSSAHEIWARFGKDERHVVAFFRYGVSKPIPTALRLPCQGQGTVTFTTCFGTVACASNATNNRVRVNFVNIAV